MGSRGSLRLGGPGVGSRGSLRLGGPRVGSQGSLRLGDPRQGYFYQISKGGGGGHLRFWTFSKTNFGPFLTKDAKLWTFLYGV